MSIRDTVQCEHILDWLKEKKNHTPGPWKVKQLDGILYVNPDRVGEYQLICKMISMHPAREANARLIAAAPYLLKALHKIFELADVEYADTDKRAIQRQTIQLEARVAIAKAEG
jgi:hypothetical protein